MECEHSRRLWGLNSRDDGNARGYMSGAMVSVWVLGLGGDSHHV
jgi:hypothetical protein